MRHAFDAVRAGCGLAYVFRQFAAPALEDESLVAPLERHTRPRAALHRYYPSPAQMPGKLRAFIDFIREANWVVPG